jgi:hypothetical protein
VNGTRTRPSIWTTREGTTISSAEAACANDRIGAAIPNPTTKYYLQEGSMDFGCFCTLHKLIDLLTQHNRKKNLKHETNINKKVKHKNYKKGMETNETRKGKYNKIIFF